MPMLDFIKKRHQQKPENPPQQSQKPAPANEIAQQQNVQEKATAMVERLKPEAKAMVEQARAKLEQAAQQPTDRPSAPEASRPEGASSPQPMAQKMLNQDKAAPELSPTSAQAGTRATEQEKTRQPEERAKAQQKTEERSRTEARRGQSWER